jgi:hypothetical protein
VVEIAVAIVVEIAAEIAAVIVAVAGAGAAVADVTAVDVRKAHPLAAATCLPPSTLRRKAESLAATIRTATTTVAAISADLKIAPASRAVSNHVAPRSAGSIIVRRRFSSILPVPPRPSVPRKNPSFCLANLSPSIVASPWPRPFPQLSSRNLTSRNLKAKKQFLVPPAT